jgi:hypothetical protein
VRTVRRGDLAICPFAFSDGTCPHCLHGITTACIRGGFFPAFNGDGGQGEAVRVPLADGTHVPVPGSGHSDDMLRSLLTLCDVMGTGHQAAVCARVAPGQVVARPGSTVGYVGVPHDVELPVQTMFFGYVGVLGGPARARAYLPELLEDGLADRIDPGRSWTTRPDLDGIADAYARRWTSAGASQRPAASRDAHLVGPPRPPSARPRGLRCGHGLARRRAHESTRADHGGRHLQGRDGRGRRPGGARRRRRGVPREVRRSVRGDRDSINDAEHRTTTLRLTPAEG